MPASWHGFVTSWPRSIEVSQPPEFTGLASSYTYPAADVFAARGPVGREYLARLERLVNLPEFARVRSVILVGSVARGEQSILEHEGKLESLSDIEMLVVVSEPLDRGIQRRFAARFAAEQASWDQRNPFFHLDVSVVTSQKLRRLPRNIFAHETRERALVVRGEDLRYKIPEVTLRKLDLGAINELILIRLWSLLLYMPRQVMLGGATEFEALLARYVLSRNLLEIPTILYPNVEVLLPSYRERIAALDRVFGQSWLRKYFRTDLSQTLVEAFEAKIQPERLWETDTRALYRSTLDGYMGLIGFLTDEPDLAARPDWQRRILTARLRLSDRRIVRRNAHEVLEALAMARSHGWVDGLRWAVTRRRRIAICCFLHAHSALLAHMEHDTSLAEAHMEKAERLLPYMWPPARRTPGHLALQQRWLTLREQVIPFMTHFYRFNRSKSRQFMEVHRWADR